MPSFLERVFQLAVSGINFHVDLIDLADHFHFVVLLFLSDEEAYRVPKSGVLVACPYPHPRESFTASRSALYGSATHFLNLTRVHADTAACQSRPQSISRLTVSPF